MSEANIMKGFSVEEKSDRVLLSNYLSALLFYYIVHICYKNLLEKLYIYSRGNENFALERRKKTVRKAGR